MEEEGFIFKRNRYEDDSRASLKKRFNLQKFVDKNMNITPEEGEKSFSSQAWSNHIETYLTSVRVARV